MQSDNAVYKCPPAVENRAVKTDQPIYTGANTYRRSDHCDVFYHGLDIRRIPDWTVHESLAVIQPWDLFLFRNLPANIFP